VRRTTWSKARAAARRWGLLLPLALIGLAGAGCSDATAPASLEALCGRQCYQISQSDCGGRSSACIASCVDAAESVPARCRTKRDAALSCSADAEYACDGDEPVATGCERAVAALASCVGDGATVDGDAGSADGGGDEVPGPADASTPRDGGRTPGDAGAPADGSTSGGEPQPSCSTVCERAFAAGCADPGACGACEELRVLTPASCADELTALESCATSATFVCDPEGSATADACDPTTNAWASCVQAVYPNAFGSPNPDLTLCNVSSGEPCGACLSSTCCAEFADCAADPECQALLSCGEACTDAACYAACDRAHPSAVLLQRSLFACANTACVQACTGPVPAP
jgi:hypothetical protein